MSNMYKCNNCGIEYGDSLEAVVCCGEGSSMVNDEDEPETNELGQEKWEEHVEEQIIEAELHLERALHACESSDQRGSLIGTYRDIVGFLFRHYDVAYEEHNDE